MVRVPQLGRPVYATLGLAITVLVVIYGGMELWPRIEAYRQMRALDGVWRDRSRPAAARAKAAEMLAEYGPEATPYLLGATRDADGLVREKAYTYLAGLEPIPEEAFDVCLAAVSGDRDPRPRAAAAAALGAVAYNVRERHTDQRGRIIEALLRAGHDPASIVRVAAVRGLIGAQAVEVDASPWLEDADRSVRLAAAEAVFWLDPAHKARAVPMLQTMVIQAGPEHPRDVVRPMALLFRADPSACRGLVPTFAAWLRREDAEVRGRVVVWLGYLGPMARDATPALEALLDRGLPADRARVAMALIHIDPTGCDRAAACLLALLADATIPPLERGMALHSFDALFKQARVPDRLRREALAALRTIPDQPGIHPQLGEEIRRFVAFHQKPRRPSRHAPGPGPRPTARLISAH